MPALRRLTPRLMTTILLPFALSSVAQEVETALSNDGDGGIETIEVVAQKRVSTLQETPIAISAFNADSLENQGIEDANDIQFAIPNAIISGSASKPDFTIRGVGSNPLTATGDPGAGVHLNGVYMTSNNFQNEFYDLQAIEVLRGPQGTLYGRNTTAGVLNIITARPTDEVEGYLSAEVANYRSFRTIGALNLPLTETINQRFAFTTTKRDGYTENIADNVDFNELDGRDQYSIRSTTAFEFSEQANGLLVAQYFKEDSDRSLKTGVLCKSDLLLGCAAEEIASEYPNSGFLDGNIKNIFALFGVPYPVRSDFYNTNLDGSARTNPSDPRKVRLDYQPSIKQDEIIASFEFNYDFGGSVFTSVTAYHDREFKSYVDFDSADGADAFLVPVAYHLENERVIGTRHSSLDIRDRKSTQWSQEIRFATFDDGPFNYTVGAFYLDYEASSQVDFYVPELGILTSILNATTPLSLSAKEEAFSFQTPHVSTKAWAVFGEGYYDINKELTLTVGVRYTDEEKEVKTRQISPLTYALGGNTQFYNDKADWQETTGKIGLSYSPELEATDETLIFGTISRGYKGGGINPGASETSFPTYDPEYINSFEIGTKNTFWDRTFQANVTAFYYDYDGLQVSGLLEDSTTFNTNIDAEVKGAEFEFVAAPMDGLTINLNLSFLDSEVAEDYIAPPDNAYSTSRGPVNLKGNELAHAPDQSIQFGIQYDTALNDNWNISYRAQTYWQSDYWGRLYNSPTDKLDSWQQTDFSVTLRDSDDIWEIEAFVKNADDEASLTGISVEGAFVGRYRKPTYLEPRIVGLKLKYSF